MASIENRNGSWRVIFRYRGAKHCFTLGEVSASEAYVAKASTEELLRLLSRHLVSMPAGCGIEEFMQHRGKPPEVASQAAPRREEVSLGQLRDDYVRTHRSSLEPNTVATIEMHFRHLAGCLGEKLPIATLSLADLQKYVQHREGKVQAGTIKMEVISLRTAWNWGARFGLVEGPFPSKGLRFPKSKEKPPFMTWAEVERRIAQGGDPGELWDCLYLNTEQVAQLLDHVKAKAIQPWVYPMAVFAAHTGARRSEMLRARMEDVDFVSGVVTVREKKRRRGVDSTRRVPMSSLLRQALEEYLKVRPDGCPLLFCQGAGVVRSKKKGRVAEGVTKDEAHNHLERALAGSKWEVLRGWHVLRHSFISALANRGVDQRVIQDMVGHMTAEMQRRYAHLYPSTKQDAIRLVFG